MQRRPIYGYYSFGYNYRRLRFDTLDDPVRGGDDSLAKAIDEFLDTLFELDLRVTWTAGKELRALRARLDEMPQSATVDAALSKEVEDAVDMLDRTLDAELHLSSAYILTPKRFGIEELVQAPQKLLGNRVYGRLSPMCQFDFTEACRCIAFSVPTAAAFHLMRTVEGRLRDYYRDIVKRGRVDPLLWAKMVHHLRRRRDKPPEALLDSLDKIRVNFRNPTQHPDARYDLDEAQDLMAIAVESLNRMDRDSRSRST